MEDDSKERIERAINTLDVETTKEQEGKKHNSSNQLERADARSYEGSTDTQDTDTANPHINVRRKTRPASRNQK